MEITRRRFLPAREALILKDGKKSICSADASEALPRASFSLPNQRVRKMVSDDRDKNCAVVRVFWLKKTLFAGRAVS